MRFRRIIVAAGAFLAACSSSSNSNGGGNVPAGVSIAGGAAQTSETGATLLLPLTVVVADSAAKPLAGVQVTWTVTQGGGTVSPATSTTDANGKASTSLTLGSVAGINQVSALAAGSSTPVVFTATATTPVAAPKLIASVPVPTGSTYDHDTYVRDGLAFAMMWRSGVRIYDVGNGISGGSPANPVLVSALVPDSNGVPGGPQIHNGWWFHNPVSHENRYLFLGQEGSCPSIGTCSIGDIHIIDVIDIKHPVEVGYVHIAGAGVHNFWMDEANQTLYAAYYNAGVIKVDVSGTLSGNMSSRIVAQVKPGGAGNTYVWGVMLSNGTLYATDMLSGFWALDPVTLATKGGGNNVPERYGSDQWVYGNTAYSGTWGTRSASGKGTPGNAIKIWSLNAAGVPTLADSLIIPNIGTVSDVAVTPDGKLLVATAEIGPGAGLYVYSRANPLKPVLVGSYLVAVGEHTGEVAVINGRTYVFAARDPGQQQMDIFDITSLIPQ